MTDPIIAHLIHYVRHELSDDAILSLIKGQLGVTKGALHAAPLAPVAKAKPGRKPGRKPGKKPGPKPAASHAPKAAAPAAAAPVKRGPGRPKGSTNKPKPGPGRPKGKVGRPAGGGGLAETLNHVERIVKASGGVAASDVAKTASIPQSRAATALKALKLAKRIYQGGDRRFARYAGDAKTAEQASLNARKNASGPQGRGGKKK